MERDLTCVTRGDVTRSGTLLFKSWRGTAAGLLWAVMIESLGGCTEWLKRERQTRNPYTCVYIYLFNVRYYIAQPIPTPSHDRDSTFFEEAVRGDV